MAEQLTIEQAQELCHELLSSGTPKTSNAITILDAFLTLQGEITTAWRDLLSNLSEIKVQIAMSDNLNRNSDTYGQRHTVAAIDIPLAIFKNGDVDQYGGPTALEIAQGRGDIRKASALLKAGATDTLIN